MKSRLFTKISLGLTLLLAAMIPVVVMVFSVHAAEVTRVQGKVANGTTSSMLNLDTGNGIMVVKLDGGTDFSECRILLTGSVVYVDVYRGDDAYLHAQKLLATSNSLGLSIDTSNITDVTGTIGNGTTSDRMYLNTSDGQMTIALDSTTDLSGTSVLYIGKQVTVGVARGSDAVLHAVRISDGTGGYSGGSSSSSAASAQNTVTAALNVPGTIAVQGTVVAGTTPEMLYLNTSGGTMKIKLDAGTDTSSVGVVAENMNIAVAVYRGEDAYLHAAKIVNAIDTSQAASYQAPVASTPSTTSTSGTVAANSNNGMLYLNTSGGTMQIKLDNNTDFTYCKTFFTGENVRADVYRGSDEYLHAAKLTWTDGSYPAQAALDSNQITVTGRVDEINENYLMSLDTSGGMMKIQIDATSDLGGEKILIVGQTYNVTVARGTDEYLHVVGVSR